MEYGYPLDASSAVWGLTQTDTFWRPTMVRPNSRSARLATITWIWLVIGASLIVTGCSSRQEANAVNRTPSFQDQIQAVRLGTTHEISSSEKITDADFIQLHGLVELEDLSLSNAFLSDDAAEVLIDLVGLQRLRLEKASLGDKSAEVIGRLSKLKTINLPDSKIFDQGIHDWPTLSKLFLLRIGSPNLTDAALDTIGRMNQLRFLHLIEVPISDQGIRSLHGMKQLESFYLDGSFATERGLSDLLEALPELHFHRDQQHIPRDRQADDHKPP